MQSWIQAFDYLYATLGFASSINTPLAIWIGFRIFSAYADDVRRSSHGSEPTKAFCTL
jgi:hypothetical protein